MADLLSHPELDPDSDGSFTEAEAQVTTVFHCVAKTLRGTLANPKADHLLYFLNIFLQGLLGGVDHVDTVGFESVWSNIRDKYTSLVKAGLF